MSNRKIYSTRYPEPIETPIKEAKRDMQFWRILLVTYIPSLYGVIKGNEERKHRFLIANLEKKQ